MTFSDPGHRKIESKGVLSIMEMLIQDLHGEIARDQEEEAAAQVQFEKELKAALALKARLEEKITNLEGFIADLKEDKTEEKKSLDANEKDLKDENEYKESITPDCDFVIDHWLPRSKKRQA